ncbi:hypothetical protein AAF712_006309 [Marasmius tenuissimus]|uniref:F-box domain-containing protein n=1 Tax=Marasmius tenuissimus TaxID=585030 RepID=A0ABR3A077_9AGAR
MQSSGNKQPSKGSRATIPVYRRVPPELWEAIFLPLCSSQTEYSLSVDFAELPHSQTVMMVPLALSQVCRLWRAIVDQCPVLWSSISLELFQIPWATRTIIQKFLVKAFGHPLNIRISSRVDSRDLAPHTPDLVTAYLLQDRIFIERLTLDVPDYQFLHKLLVRPVFFGLKYISFERGMPDIPWIKAVLKDASKLTELRIRAIDSDFDEDTVPMIPFDRLTSFTIEWLNEEDIEDFIPILGVMKNLRCLTLGCSADEEALTLFRSVPIVETKFLDTLIIDNYHGAPPSLNGHLFSVLFKSLVAPSLRTFKLLCSDSDPDDNLWPTHLTEFLRRSSASLQTFALSIRPCYGHIGRPVSEVLALVPRLKRFDLLVEGRHGMDDMEREVYRGFVEQLVSTLLSDLRRPEMVPDLESLSLRIGDIDLGPHLAQGILQLAKSRKAGAVAPTLGGLRSLRWIKFVGLMSRPSQRVVLGSVTVQDIEKLRKEGIQVTIEERNCAGVIDFE